MNITGRINIAGEWQAGQSGTFQAVNPLTGNKLDHAFSTASTQQMDLALTAAESAEPALRASTLAERSKFLHACADEIMALGDELLDQVSLETGYPRGRAEGERGRTCGQLKMFADYILTGQYLDVRIDTAQPDRAPVPKPDLRYINVALGTVVVFGASNFPLAYSVAGGDTASAFAAGCPVIVKGHPSHPGTSELVALAIDRAAKSCDMPKGVFSFISGDGHETGAYLTKAPAVKAVGFTGSFAGGTALFKLANARSEPIPVFAEMGSINPIFLLEGPLSENAESLAKDFVGSLTLGSGQFCVNPGLVVAVKSPALDTFLNNVSAILRETPSAVMLNEGICDTYAKNASSLESIDGVTTIQKGQAINATSGCWGQAQLFQTSADVFLAKPELQEEVFGPSSLVVICDNSEQLLDIAKKLKGQLTTTLHATSAELAKQQTLANLLASRAGRLVINGFPTGVEVCPAMVHGGPFPASTDGRFTSVGTAAIFRFIRPVCFQNYPEGLLPEALQDNNPLNLPRILNGKPV